MKRPALQNKRVRVLRMAFRARKVFGTFEKRAPELELLRLRQINVTRCPFQYNDLNFSVNDPCSYELHLSSSERRPEQDSNPDLSDVGAVLCQLNYQVNWELAHDCQDHLR